MSEDSPDLINPNVPSSARVWDYWLGGKDNYLADRRVGDAVMENYPEIVTLARAGRSFLRRAVTYLAGEEGIRQFLDIGTGLPTAQNTHEAAQASAPESRVVYVDNDPIVLAHARALLTSSPEGATDYIEADLQNPGKILAEARRTLDFTQPVAITLIAILHHIESYDEALSIVSHLVEAVPPGSYLMIAHATNAIHGTRADDAVARYNEHGKPKVYLRSPEQITRFFDGLDLVKPGVVSSTRWRPPAADIGGEEAPVDQFSGVARKP